MKMNVSNTNNDLAPLKRSDVDCHMLALPKTDIIGYINVECNFLYYVIESNWNEFSEKMEFNSPRSIGCRY